MSTAQQPGQKIRDRERAAAAADSRIFCLWPALLSNELFLLCDALEPADNGLKSLQTVSKSFLL